MPATLAEMRDQIVIDASIQGNPLFPVNRLNRIINLAQRSIQTELNGLGMKKWETRTELSNGLRTSAFVGKNVVEVVINEENFPQMLESPRSIIFIECSDGAVFGLAYEVDLERFREQIENTYLSPSVSAPVFIRLANKILIAPESVNSLSAYYYKAVSDLVNDSDQTTIPFEFEEYVIKKSVAEIDGILGNLDAKQLKTKQIQAEISSAYQKFLEKQVERGRVSKETTRGLPENMKYNLGY
ncbi:hypothetical protein MASR2M39_14890 [Ignavibacteriales bacterium]